MSHGVEAPGRMLCLRQSLAEWIRLNRKLGRRWMKYSKDAPWWYNERALLSIFAGAVWRTGNEAFEEFSELKRKKNRRASGRIDLWFCVGTHEFWAEAKACEIPITRSSKQARKIKEVMERAKHDVRRLDPDGFTRRLAVVFVSPYLREGHERVLPQRIDWLLEQTRAVDHSALAWVFPKLKSLPRSSGWVCPGIAVLIKEVRR